MGASTNISWCDSTINCWMGCEKVSPGCKHCYAEVDTPVRVKRAKGLELWGRGAARSETKAWAQHLRAWAHEVVTSASGTPRRVFAQSLADTFEDRRDLDDLRARFFRLVDAWECRSLTFQLLTKRPENVLRMVPSSWLKSWPGHVWIGCTVENQEQADLRIPHLLRIPAPVRFLSVEPQLSRIDLRMVGSDGQRAYDSLHGVWRADDGTPLDGKALPLMVGSGAVQWVIQGGESGPKARPFDLAWARSLRDQCRTAGVPYFLKQLGPTPYTAGDAAPFNRLRDSHGADESEWPADLRGCRAFPEVNHG